jgi:hypothetical protein
MIAAMMAAALSTPLAFAQTPAKTDKAATPAASDAEMDKYYAAMQERYKKMQDQMARLSKTTDPKERQKILEEHWKTMHEGMDTMMGRGGMGRGMMMGGMGMMGPGGGGMGVGPGGRMGAGPGPGMGPMSPEMMEQRQRRMEQRMDMMQMMMDQMMQHQGRSGPMPGAK